MKKSEIKEAIGCAQNSKEIVSVSLNYCYYPIYYLPLRSGDKLFLCAKEDDFIFNGFSIRRFRDVTKVKPKNDLCQKIWKKEGKIRRLCTPDIDVTDWHSVFSSLQKMSKYIIIEHESLDDDDWDFWIGKIIKVNKNNVVFHHFDADGIWNNDYYHIPYSMITSVSFDSRYANTFSKYV